MSSFISSYPSCAEFVAEIGPDISYISEKYSVIVDNANHGYRNISLLRCSDYFNILISKNRFA